MCKTFWPTYVIGWVKSPNFFMVAAKSLHHDPERPLNSKILNLSIGNQLGLGPKAWGLYRAIV